MGETDMPAVVAIINRNLNRDDFMDPKSARDQLKAWGKTDFSYFLKAGSVGDVEAGGIKKRAIKLTGDLPGAVLMYGKPTELKTSLTDIIERQFEIIENDLNDRLCVNFSRFKPEILINIGPIKGWWGATDYEDAGKPHKWRNFGDRTWQFFGFQPLIERGLALMETPPKDWVKVFGPVIGRRLGT
jgi:hypothetical protein